MPGHQNGQGAQSLPRGSPVMPSQPGTIATPQDSGPRPPPRDEGISAVIVGFPSATSPRSAFLPLYRSLHPFYIRWRGHASVSHSSIHTDHMALIPGWLGVLMDKSIGPGLMIQ